MSYREKQPLDPKCNHKETEVIEYDNTWRDGVVICKKCRGFVRYYDAG